jgi:hypothetical protein
VKISVWLVAELFEACEKGFQEEKQEAIALI